jgi:hypothetical protein
MALHRRVVKADVIFSKLYSDTCSDVSDEECETETLDSDVTTCSASKNTHLILNL